MKPGLTSWLRCPACRAGLALRNAVVEQTPGAGPEVTAGILSCEGCSREYEVREGVPRLAVVELPAEQVTRQTASSFGYLWGASDDRDERCEEPYHFARMAETLGLAPPQGLVLDAGCGEGIDLSQHARRGSEVIGVELSNGGCAATLRRTAHMPSAHVVQANLHRLPFADGTFALSYSFGVLHHVADPVAALREIARVTAPAGRVAVYLYEDFAERAVAWRLLLRAANQLRHVTVRLPHRALYALCQLGSPVVFLLCTVPSKVLSRLPWFRGFASRLPYSYGTGPFSLVGDLFDRFATPVELRYGRESACQLFEQAGLRIVAIANNRGWMVAGERVF